VVFIRGDGGTLPVSAAGIEALKETDHEIPAPGSGGASGRLVQRLPKSLHARLAARAKMEGVSLNTLIVAMLAEQLR
jgi:antitoxin HicB